MSVAGSDMQGQERDDASQSFIDKWRARWPEWAVAQVFVPATQRPTALAWASLLQELTDAAKNLAEGLKEPAQEAMENVKATAADATEHVKAEGQGAVADVKDKATDAKDNVQQD